MLLLLPCFNIPYDHQEAKGKLYKSHKRATITLSTNFLNDMKAQSNVLYLLDSIFNT